MQPPVIAEVAFVALGDLLLRASGFGHRRSVVEQRHVSMPEGQHEKQKRNWRVDEKPAVQPMLQLDLVIEHAALFAPSLDFFDPIAIGFGDTELNESKCIFGKTGVTEPKLFTAFG